MLFDALRQIGEVETVVSTAECQRVDLLVIFPVLQEPPALFPCVLILFLHRATRRMMAVNNLNQLNPVTQKVNGSVRHIAR